MSLKVDKMAYNMEMKTTAIPITAISTVFIKENATLLIFVAMGGFVVHNNHSSSMLSHSTLIFPHHNIHGLKLLLRNSHQLKMLVWGDKSLACISHNTAESTDNCVINNLFNIMDDLILDCHSLQSSDGELLAIGYAHHFVDIISVIDSNNFTRISRYQCPAIVVLFSLSFFGSTVDDLIMASGTAFGEIYIWQQDPIDKTAGKILSYVKQHEGVIFRLRWSDDRKHIASVSDDRTIRLWSVSESYTLSSVFVGWGHISRLWDVTFISEGLDPLLATSSEDGTVKLWNYDGRCKATLRGHEGSIWRLDCCKDTNILVSVGNDAAVKTWETGYYLYTCHEGDEYSGCLTCIPTNADVTPSGVIDENDIVTTQSNKSSRMNGVCNVFVDAASNSAVIVLSEGTIWHMRLDMVIHPIDTSPLSLPIDSTGLWQHLWSLQKPITSSHVLFHTNGLMIAATHPDGTVTMMEVDGALTCISWQAHGVRAVNIWILDASLILTASVNGSCRLWRKDSSSSGYHILVDMFTGRNEIASACHLSNHALYTSSDASYALRYLFIGDTRGGLSIYLIDDMTSYDLSVDEKSIPLYPIAFHPRVHSSDPISRIIEANDGMMSVGLDGFINMYSYYHPKSALISMIEQLTGHDITSRNAVLVHLYHEKSVIGRVLGQHSYPLNPIRLVSRLSTLPIKSPDSIILSSSSSHQHNPSILVTGYVGSLFIVWDITHKHELMRVEGGGWKRPHHCSILFNSNMPSNNPRIVYLSPIPLKHNTAMNLVDTKACYSNNTMIPSPKLPYYLRSHSHGKVSYSGAIAQSITADAVKSYAFIGGELGNILVFPILSDLSSTVIMPEKPLQHVDMPSNVAVKAIATSASRLSPNRGIMVAAGGKLRYAIWNYDFNPIESDSISSNQRSSYILSYEISGSLWPKATQDHRALAVDIASYHVDTIEGFIILICDSRGIASIGWLPQPVILYAGIMPSTQFTILEQYEASPYPILCCKMGYWSQHKIAIAILGDTAGCVHIYSYSLVHDSTFNGPIINERKRLISYQAHAIGCNAIDIMLPPSKGDEHIFRLLISSGGDDQAITVCHATITMTSSSNSCDCELQIHDIERVECTSGSAINGLQFLSASPATYNPPHILVAAVGYDQRLNIWRAEDISSLSSIETRWMAQPTSITHEPRIVSRQQSRWLRWVTGMITHVSDVNAMCASSILTHDTCHKAATPREQSYQIMTIGEGFEVCTINPVAAEKLSIPNK